MAKRVCIRLTEMQTSGAQVCLVVPDDWRPNKADSGGIIESLRDQGGELLVIDIDYDMTTLPGEPPSDLPVIDLT